MRPLGRTGVDLPVLGLGTAPAGHRIEKDALEFFQECLDAGITHIDTGPQTGGYGHAQVYLGKILRERRDELFIATRCDEPDGEKALKQLTQNLAHLGIERADLVYAQSLGADAMTPEKIYGPAGVCKALEKARADGLTRFLGVTGHHKPWRFLRAIQEWDFDVMMNPVSIVARHIYDFEGHVWPAAQARGIALIGMKVFGGVKESARSPKGALLDDELKQQALRYALGLPGVTGVVIGMYDGEELRQLLEWVRNPLSFGPEDLKEIELRTRTLAGEWQEVYGPVI
ncbi:MAG TPA: aldo/keto reductase [Chthoniobacterales bacterium]|nr:aldo/keto reductase [Chthoniobacterales bacterium]